MEIGRPCLILARLRYNPRNYRPPPAENIIRGLPPCTISLSATD